MMQEVQNGCLMFLMACPPLLSVCSVAGASEQPSVIATLNGHDGPVYSIAFDPDGRRLASASWDHTVILWDVATHKKVATFEGHTAKVNWVSFSPDGKALATASDDETIRLWDAKTGKNTAVLKGEAGVFVKCVRFSHDSKSLVSVSHHEPTIRIWDVASRKNTKSIGVDPERNHAIWSIAYSPDSKMLASGNQDRTIQLWNVESGKAVLALDCLEIAESVAFAPKENILASACGKTVKIWDITSGKNLAVLKGHADDVLCVAFRRDGNLLASGSHDKTVKIWDLKSGENIATLSGHDNLVFSVEFSPDGKLLASASKDGDVKLWKVNIDNPD